MSKRQRSRELAAQRVHPAVDCPPKLEDRSYLAYLRPTSRPFLHFVSGHFPVGTVTRPHSHPCIAVHGCLQGPLTLCTPERENILDTGVFYVIGPGLHHSWRNDGRHMATTMSLLLDTENPGRWPRGTDVKTCCRGMHGQIQSFHRFTTSGDQELHHTFWLAADHLMAEQPREPLTLAGVLLALLGQIKERLGSEQTTLGDGSDAAKQIRQLLLARVRDRLSIREIAHEVEMSPTRAKELFRASFGCGIMTYFNHLKIWQAKRLLNDLSLTVEQVSDQLGFSRPSYFSRAFHKQTGETPTAYRKGNEN